jgi:hypothetical protein
MEPPGEQNGKGDFVELDPSPVGFPVDPEVLGKASVCLLTDGEIDQGPQRGLSVPGREQTGGAVDHIPGPNQVIPSRVFIPPGFSPGDREGRDEGAGVGFVLVGQEETVTGAIQVASIPLYSPHA